MTLLRPFVAPRRVGPSAVFALVAAGAALAALTVAFTLVTMPVGQLVWGRGAYLCALVLGLLLGLRLTRTGGRRGRYVVGVAAVGLTTAIAALGGGPSVLVPALLAQALAAGVVLPASLRLLGAATPPERRTRGTALWAVVVAAAAGVGWLAGALLSGWRPAFGVGTALAVLLLVAAHHLLVEPGLLGVPPDPGTLIAPVGAVGSATSATSGTSALAPNEEALFFHLPEAARDRLAAGNRRVIAAGEWIVQQGEASDSMFVIRSGRAEVIIGSVAVRELGPGSVVGELGLLTGGIRSASVRARRDCDVIEVSREVWDSAVLTDPAAVAILVKTLAGQLADTAPSDPLPIPVPSVIGVAAADARTGALATRVTETLLDLLGGHGRVVALAPEQAPGLERAVRDNDWVIVSSDGADPQWHDYVLRQSDRLVLVADSNQTPITLPRSIGHRPELVLIGSRPASATFAAWTSSLDPWRITLAGERSLPADLRHLVTRLAGRSVGLVLSGGGARAMTHIGVIQELEEAGVEIDRIAGASLGAIVGLVYASGVSAAELAERGYAALVRGRPYGDYSLPDKALTRGRRHLRLLEDHVGDLLIEELPRGFRCVSVDLRTRGIVVHRSGPAAVATAASSRLPIVFPPMAVGSQLLIDGGALDNMPVNLLTERDEGPVIAVNVMPDDYGETFATPGIPSLVETLLRITELNADELGRAEAAGAYILHPRTLGVGTLDFHHFETMVESGRLAARQLLEKTGGDLTAG